MRMHRTVLAGALKKAGHTHKSISKEMGWASPASAGHKLTGRTDWASGELSQMCGLAGVTICWLSENSDDIPLSRSKSSIEIAVIVDEFDEKFRQALIKLLRSM